MGKSRRKKPPKPAAPRQAGNLLDSVKNSFTPEVVHRASSMISEPEAATRRALEASASSVVNGLSRLASSHEGAENLRALLEKNSYQYPTGNVPVLFSGGNATASTLRAGEQLLGRLFGRDVSSVTEQVASAGGVKTASAGELLALVAPLALSLLAKRASTQGLNASEIASLLTTAEAEPADAGSPPREVPRGRRWGPVLVPKQRKEEDVGWRAEILDKPAELLADDEEATAHPGPAPHPVRRIFFLLLALTALALLILLLIRGPARRTGNDRQPRTLAVRLEHSNIDLRRGARFYSCASKAPVHVRGYSTLCLPALLDKT